jgi:hypothetical protein
MSRLSTLKQQIATVRAEREAELARSQAEADRIADAERTRGQVEIDRAELVAAQRASLARDLGLDDDSAVSAIVAKRDACPGDTKRLWAPLIRLWHSIDKPIWYADAPNPQTAREARHVLAGEGLLPPVRSDDAAFGSDASVRGAVPSPVISAGGTISDPQYGALVAALGLTIPREKAPDAESPQEARKRLGPSPVTYGMAAMIVGGRDEHQPRSMRGASWPTRGEFLAMDDGAKALQDRVDSANDARARELKLIDEAWQIACHEARADRDRAVVSQRERIVAAIDRALADSPMNARWFWLRALRRLAAGERQVAIADNSMGFDYSVERLFSLARTAGARINVSTPSKKK